MTKDIGTMISDFKMLKSLEAQSGDYYERMLLLILKNEEDRIIVKGIIEDERRHERMVAGVIDILEQI